MTKEFITMLLITILAATYQLTSAADVTYTIEEELPLNTFIGNIRQDTSLKDIVGSDSLGTLTYSILQAGNPQAKLFNISSGEGSLYTAARVDREKLCLFTSECELLLEVAVHSDTSFYSYEIKIVVEDTNDNKPSFPEKSVSLEIPESSQIGVSFSFDGAVDVDTDKNSLKSYELVPPDAPFGVSFTKNLDGTSTVSVSVKSALDREKTDSYLLTLIAKDNGTPQRSSSTLVNISISDVNDNSPEFTHTVYNVTVKENTPLHTVFFTVKATDRDIGVNKEILYQLSSHQPNEIKQHFEIDEHSGELRIKKALPSGNMRVIVEATDRGSPTKSSQAFIDIEILDTNNQRPSITVNLFNGLSTAHVSESKKIGYAFAHVKISDPDTGRNGNVRCYSQTADFDLKQLDVNEYKVVVAKQLNREAIAKYTVVIYCEDSGEQKLNTSATFDVVVDDENDNAPRFLQKWYEAYIPENNAVNDTILQVAAADNDVGINSQITYFLSENARPYFFIPRGTFMIKALQSFDRETLALYNFSVFAVDGGSPPLTASAKVMVTILDVNDEHPEFSQKSYLFYIVENCPVNTIVGNVSATDNDTGLGGHFSFVLSPSYTLNHLPFTILQNGSIVTTGNIDAEAKNIYNFNVIATDHAPAPLSGVADVKIIIVDQNDNKPMFIFPNSENYSVTVYVPKTANSVISWVRADDPDIDSKGVIYKLMDKNVSNIFNINETSGQIYLFQDVDSSNIGYYELLITAVDKQDESLFNRTLLKVFLRFQVGDSSSAVGGDQNVVIVITLVCATVVIAASVLLVVCYIRKCDKDKAYKNSFSSNSGTASDGKSCSVHDLTSDRTGKEHQLNDSLDKPASSDSLEEKHIFKVGLSNDVLEDNVLADRDHQKLNQLASFRLHQALQHINSHRTSPQQTQQVLAAEGKGTLLKDGQKPADDYHSNDSGETVTGDSGHGSDDEVLFPDQVPTSPRRIKLGVGAITNPLRYRTYTSQRQSHSQKPGQTGSSTVQKDRPPGQLDHCLPYSIQNGPEHQHRRSVHQQNGPLNQHNRLIHQQNGPVHQQNGPVHQQNGPVHQQKGPVHQFSSPDYQQNGPVHQHRGPLHQQNVPEYQKDERSRSRLPQNDSSHSRSGSVHVHRSPSLHHQTESVSGAVFSNRGSVHLDNQLPISLQQNPESSNLKKYSLSNISAVDKTRDQNKQVQNPKPSYKVLGVPVLPVSGEEISQEHKARSEPPSYKIHTRSPHRSDNNIYEGDDTTTSGSYSVLSDDTKLEMAFATVTDVYV